MCVVVLHYILTTNELEKVPITYIWSYNSTKLELNVNLKISSPVESLNGPRETRRVDTCHHIHTHINVC